MTTDDAVLLVRELDRLQPAAVDRLPVERRAIYRKAIDLAAAASRIRPNHATALRLAIRQEPHR